MELQNKILNASCLDVLKEIGGGTIDCIVTDPPYGDNSAYGRNSRTIANNEDPLLGLMVIRDCYELLKPNTTSYFFLDIKHLPMVKLFIEQYTKYKIRDWVVWDKVNMGMGFGFRKRHELILVLEKGKPKYNNLGLPNVLNFKRVNTDDHPHKKPVELLSQLILQSTDEGGLVFDPFAGSGSTLVAAKELKREYIGVELDAEYCRIAQERLDKIPV